MITAVLFLSISMVHAASFNEVKEVVFAHPATALPEYKSVSATSFLKAVVSNKGEIVKRSKATFKDTDDFRKPRPKLLHPKGVCAVGAWVIDQDNPYTGLFTKGTKVPAIVRMSSGTTVSRLNPKHARMFGMAIKLFPTHDKEQDVVTKNIFTLDNNGFAGSFRKFYLDSADRGKETYFTNNAPPTTKLGKFVNWFFARFDKNPDHRPLYPVASVTQEDKRVGSPVVPEPEVRFYPRRKKTVPFKEGIDFREELLQYDAGEIGFAIVADGKRIGKLILGKPVVSEGCDLTLHFHHDFNLH